jgi:hypothetical protein
VSTLPWHGVRDGEDSTTKVVSVVVAAILGSFMFGIVMSLTMGEVLFGAIPGMYGLTGLDPVSSVVVGWVIHIFHGVVLGLVYGVVVVVLPASGDTVRNGVVTGLGYGVVLWVLLASFLMPFWVGLATPMDPPVPNWNPWSLVGHLLYGAFLGVLIPVYRRY